MGNTKYQSHSTVAVVDPTSSVTDPYVLKINSDGSINANAAVTPGGTQDVNLTQTAGVAVARGHGTAATALRVELPTDGTGRVGVDQSTFGVTNGVTGVSQGATYAVAGAGLAGYATPTDLVYVENPLASGKVVSVTRLSIYIQSTASALQSIYFIKRSALNSGGAQTNPALVPYDSTNAAAVSIIRLYTGAPTPGAAAGTIRVQQAASATLTAGTAQIDLYTAATLGTTIAITQPVTLRPGEALAINYNGAALTVGFLAAYLVEVVER